MLTLAVHELATNASKYGAFKYPAGSVDVRWHVDLRGDQGWLEFGWSEIGVETGPEPEQRRGFGTELVTRRVPYELGGSGELAFEPGGMKGRITFPLTPGESILQPGEPAFSADERC